MPLETSVSSQSYLLCYFVTITVPFKIPLIFKWFWLSVTFYFHMIKILNFEKSMCTIYIFLFNQKKNVNESCRILVETYDDNVPMQDNLKDKRSGQPKKKLKMPNCKHFVVQRWYTNSTTNDKEGKCWSLNHLWSSACQRNDPESRKMDTSAE